jgi:hypothetical protein
LQSFAGAGSLAVVETSRELILNSLRHEALREFAKLLIQINLMFPLLRLFYFPTPTDLHRFFLANAIKAVRFTHGLVGRIAGSNSNKIAQSFCTRQTSISRSMPSLPSVQVNAVATSFNQVHDTENWKSVSSTRPPEPELTLYSSTQSQFTDSTCCPGW